MQLKPEVRPVVNAARKVPPVAIREKVKEELDRMENLNVISKVDEPTKWVNSMVVVPKPNGAVRVCLDPRDRNKAGLLVTTLNNSIGIVISCIRN